MGTTKQPTKTGPRRWARLPAATREELGLQTLIELAEDIVGVPNPYKVAELAVLNLMGGMGTPLAAIWAISEEGEAVRMRHFGFDESVLRMVESQCLPKLRDEIDPEGAIPIVIADSGDLFGARLQSTLLAADIEMLCLFKVQGEPIAVLIMGPTYRGDFDSFQHKVLETALCYVSAALENSHLQAQLTEHNRRLRQMSERLGDLDRLKQQFMDNLTHELRTPLTIISGCVDLALTFGEVNDDGRENLIQAALSTRMLDQMISRMLELRDVQKRALHVDCRKCDLSEFVTNYATDREPGVSGDLRELAFEVCVDELVVEIDRRLLAQVIDALVDNSVKFTPRGTRIVISLDRTTVEGQDFAVVQVSDNGPGIPAPMLERIFDFFRQVDGSATRQVGGTGLGLAYAREIMTALGGQILIESTEGEGTTCRVLIPVTVEAT